MFANKLLNLLVYAYKRDVFLLDIFRYFREYEEVKIRKPIFLLGTHGSGLTLVSRIIRKNRNVVSVSGNHNYWSGADEMHVVLGPILPFEFTGIRHKVPDHADFEEHTSWLYASDELIDEYRLTEKDVTEELREKFRHTIRWLIDKHAVDLESARFTDKSQSFTVKVSFINEILQDTDPRFVLITRNPYAVCYRAPFKAGGLKRVSEEFSFEELLEFASQHWSNSIKYALEDSSKVDYFMSARFEDILREPEEQIKRICEFADLDFDIDMLPQPEHEIPFGSRFRDKWYPLRPNVNKKYFKEMSQEHVRIIDRYCGGLASKFDYEKPKINGNGG